MFDKKTTIHDVAKAADVGVGTVSRVLNNHPNVSEKTRRRVLQVIERIGFHPHFPARYIRTKRSQLLGFLSDAVATTPFAVNIIKGAQDQARKSDKLLLMIDADGNPSDREDALGVMRERSVEGVVYAAMFHQEVSLSESFYGLPTVLLDCFVSERNLPSVVPDEVDGAYQATQHLIGKGHRRIALITNDRLDTRYPAAVGRYEGFKKAMAASGLPVDPLLVREGDGNAGSGFDRTLELLALAEPPTAIFCGTDRIAMGAYDAIKKRGLRIPDDVAVVGFDNQEVIASYLHPPLTTMALPHDEMGRWAVDYLIRQLEGEALGPVQHKLPCPLVVRGSA